MRSKTILSLLLILQSVTIFSQENSSKFDLRLGGGISILGSGDMQTFNFENELNYKWNKYFANSASLNFGRSNRGVYINTSFVQGNANVFFSPFKNDRRFDFRIGTGISYYNVFDTKYDRISYDGSGCITDVRYKYDSRNSLGYNIILENSYQLSEKMLLGLKIFTQPFRNGDINSGVLLKLGYRF